MDKTEWQEEKQMLQIFHLENDTGYSLLDAMISIFIAGVVLIAVATSISGLIKLTKKNNQQITEIIAARNSEAEKVFKSVQ